MKTVMKKLFSMLLVAVLLVSAIPAAFADEVVCTKEGCPNIGEAVTYNAAYDKAATCTEAAQIGYDCQGGHVELRSGDDATGHIAGDAATCTAAQTCTACGEVLEAAKDHNVVDGACTDCDYAEPVVLEVVRQDITWQIKNVEGGAVVNSGSFTPNGETAAAKDILYYHVFNKTTAWKDQYSVDKVWSSKQQADVGYNGAIPEGDTVTYVLTPKNTSSGNSGNSGSSSSGNSGSTGSTGTYSLKVWAKVYIGDTLDKTILLDTIPNLSATDKIYNVIAANKSLLEGQFPSGYTNIKWADTVFYKNDDDEVAVVDTDMMLIDENEVFIELWSADKLVVINVHTSKSYSVDLNVRMRGFRVGDTVTYDDVLKAVKKYYNVSSMKLYTYNNMQNLIEGRPAKEILNFVVNGGDNVYEVLLDGSRKGGSYTYTADSTNPKTGDAIYTPVIVMGASVTALAVLFFLNKKRSII